MLLDPLPNKSSHTHTVGERQCHNVEATWQKRKEGKTRRRQTGNIYLHTKPFVSKRVIPEDNKSYVPLFSAQLNLYYRQLPNFEDQRDNKQLLPAQVYSF